MAEEKHESLVDSVVGAVKARFEHPVFGVFVVALIISNWRFFVCLIVSDSTAEYRINQAAATLTLASLASIPIAVTLGYVLLAPILRALATIYDRFILNWESVRAHKSQIRVIESKIVSVKTELTRVEAELNAKALDLQRQEAALQRTTDTLNTQQQALVDFQSFNAVNWRALFGNIPLPIDASVNPAKYNEWMGKFKRIEQIKKAVLRPHTN